MRIHLIESELSNDKQRGKRKAHLIRGGPFLRSIYRELWELSFLQFKAPGNG